MSPTRTLSATVNNQQTGVIPEGPTDPNHLVLALQAPSNPMQANLGLKNAALIEPTPLTTAERIPYLFQMGLANLELIDLPTLNQIPNPNQNPTNNFFQNTAFFHPTPTNPNNRQI